MKPEKSKLKKTLKTDAKSAREAGTKTAGQVTPISKAAGAAPAYKPRAAAKTPAKAAKKTAATPAVSPRARRASGPSTAAPAPVAAVPPPAPAKASAPAAVAPISSAPVKAAAPARRKAPARATHLTVPPLLLEGDQPSAPAASGPGQRYALGPVPPPAHPAPFGTSGDLPEAYGTKALILTARDPHWLYARWDLTRQQQRAYNALSPAGHLVLRVFVDNFSCAPFSEIHVHPESTHWFIHTGRAGTKFLAQLGYYDAAGAWVGISSSAATLTPPDSMSDDLTVEFATIPIEVPFAEVLALAKEVVRENVPLLEIIEQLNAAGFAEFAQEAEAVLPRWTPERERALAAIITMDKVRRVWMGSLEITELIRRQMQQDVSSLAAAQIKLPAVSAVPAGGVSSVSSPFGGVEQKPGFWFNVNAELIIYGATEPDARVTIGGRPIKLRADGTFSYRFALPDGKYELPAVAVSADGTDGRAAELKFTRDTRYRGDVGAHPQDEQLKAPLAANVV